MSDTPRALSVGVLAWLIALTTAAPAGAAPSLSKSSARAKTYEVARDAYIGIDTASDFWVEGSSSCSRVTSRVVDCDFAIFFEDGTVCENAVRVRRKQTGRVTWTVPWENDCYSGDDAER